MINDVMTPSRNRIAYVYKQSRTFGVLVNSFIDLYCTRRIAARAGQYNRSRRGKLVIFAHDYIGIQINQYGYFEKLDLEMIFAFLDPILPDIAQGVALDIGANIGNHSLYFSPYFLSVYAFEPHPLAYNILLLNSQTEKNIVPVNKGLGDTSQYLPLTEDLDNMGSSFLKQDWSEDEHKVFVKIDRLDDIDLGPHPISFIKIDVEGFESSVLRGARRVICEYQPLVVMEQLSKEFVNGSTEAIQLLQEEGYLFCWYQPWATSRGWLARRVNSIRNLIFGGSYNYNFIAGPAPPPATYDMLIAVPLRFQHLLLSSR